MNDEIKLKLQVPPKSRRAVWAALMRGQLTPTRLQVHDFDTADGRLARAQVSLRLRCEGARWIQTLTIKAGDGSGLDRMEHSVDLESPGDAVPALDLDRHVESLAGERLRKVLKRAGRVEGSDMQVVEVCRTEVDRHSRLLSAPGGVRVELAFDEGRMVAGDRQHALCELKLERKGGPLSGMFLLAERWLTGHGLWIDPLSKSMRSDMLRQGRLHADPVKARPPSVSAATDARAFARGVIAACLAQVLPNAAAVAQGSTEAEHVHQLRVGLRRLRTAVSELAEFDTGLDPMWEAPLADAFRALGQARDQGTLASSWRAELREAGAPDLTPPPTQDPAADPVMSERIQASKFQATLLAALAFAVDASPAAGPAFDGSPLEALSGRLDQLHRAARRSARRFTGMAAADQHRVRKRLKRLRYLAEFIGPLFRGARAADYLKALEPAQDALGRLNDEIVALEAFRQDTGREAGAWFAVGWLSARQEASAALAAKALAQAGKARRFWHGQPRRKPMAAD